MEKTVAAQAPVDEMIPVADLLDFLRQAAKGQDWCGSAEFLVTDQLGIEFRKTGKRFTPRSSALTEVRRAEVVEFLKTARREYPNKAAAAARAAVEKFNLPEADTAFRVRVTFEIDAEELADEGWGWPTDKEGIPTDLNHDALRSAIESAFPYVERDRWTVEVTR